MVVSVNKFLELGVSRIISRAKKINNTPIAKVIGLLMRFVAIRFTRG
jgi:hypothetical protein